MRAIIKHLKLMFETEPIAGKLEVIQYCLTKNYINEEEAKQLLGFSKPPRVFFKRKKQA